MPTLCLPDVEVMDEDPAYVFRFPTPPDVGAMGAATCWPPRSSLYQLGLLGCLPGCMFLQGAYAARAAMPPPPT